MEEAFLHFIWQYQLFDRINLQTTEEHNLVIFEPGYKNTNAGPDFSQGKIQLEDIVWNGNIEIHLKSSDWYKHNHQEDKSYDNVILHVVWENDKPVTRQDGSIIPVLELKNRIDSKYLLSYKNLLKPDSEILCQSAIDKTNSISVINMLDRALTMRLKTKAGRIFRQVALTDNNWGEISWRMLSRNFGFKTNADPFEILAKSVPIKILKKEAYDLQKVEAIFFGMAGFLDTKSECSYSQSLLKDFDFLRRKYGLERQLDRHQWKFLRLRPANFPTIRLAQLASMVSKHPNLFSDLVHFESLKLLSKKLLTEQSQYWQAHYDFGKKASSKVGVLGNSSIENIIINTVVPLVFSYAEYRDDQESRERAIELLNSVKAENNAIVKKWRDIGVEVKSAFYSQAVLELYNSFCLKKQCLNCSIGAEIIRKG